MLNLTPSFSSQCTSSGAACVIPQTAFGSARPHAAFIVSVKCSSGLSFSSFVFKAALIPPSAITDCARSDGREETSFTLHPFSAACKAAESPASPAPIIIIVLLIDIATQYNRK
jgi:hypothetical protein